MPCSWLPRDTAPPHAILTAPLAANDTSGLYTGDIAIDSHGRRSVPPSRCRISSMQRTMQQAQCLIVRRHRTLTQAGQSVPILLY